MPRLKPIPTTDTVTLLDTDTPESMATTDTVTLLDTDTPDTMVLATPDTAVATVLDTDTVTVLATTDTEATTARGPLMPSPPLMPPLMPPLIPTTDTTAMDTTVLDTLDTAVPTDTVLVDTAATATATATDTTVKCPVDSSQPKTILGTTSSEKWIAQFGSTPTSATSFSATMLAQARNGEQEAKENQNVMIRRIKKLKPKKK